MVVSLPRFTTKPAVKAAAWIANTFTLNCSATGDLHPVISWKKQGGQLPVGRTEQINCALVIRDIENEDAGIYICVAKSAGVFAVETISYVYVQQLKKLVKTILHARDPPFGGQGKEGGGIYKRPCVS